MNDIPRLFEAFLAPALFVSATALLILSINVRLMGIVNRLRQFVHAKYDAAKGGRAQEAEAYTVQIASIERRAEIVRRSFLLALLSLTGTISSCLLLGLGLYVKDAALAAALYYIREVTVSLSSVNEEARDLRFMDLGTPPESGHHGPL
jgi:uncharacterized protein DUF2721